MPYRSNQQRCSIKKGVLKKNLFKSTFLREHLHATASGLTKVILKMQGIK